MINKQDNKDQDSKTPTGELDTAKMAVECHLVIRDKENNRVLVNKRG